MAPPETMPARFQRISPSDLPLAMWFYREEDNVLVWDVTVTEAPVAVEIPALAKDHGPVWVELEFGDGETVEEHPYAC